MEQVDRIIKIQKSYFDLLADCFRGQIDEVLRVGGDVEAGIKNWAYGKTEEHVIHTVKRRLEDLQNFWKLHYEELRTSLISLDILPAYSVSRPMFLRRQITSAGLYVDTVVCHDDTLSGLRNFDFIPPEKRLRLAINLLRDYIDVLQLRNCFTASLNAPFAIFCPGERDFDFNIDKKMIDSSLKLVTIYANDLLQAGYSSWEEAKLATQEVTGSAAIKKAIKRMDILPAPFRKPKTDADRLSQCFERMRMLQEQSLPSKSKQPNLKDLLMSFVTEFGVMEGQLHGSIELDLAPLFPRYLWDLYKWRVQRGNLENSRVLGWEERRTTAISTAVQHEDMDWLSGISLEEVIRLKEEGFLEDFRQRLRQARRRMNPEEAADFSAIAEVVAKDIEAAISEHIANIKNLEQEARRRLKLETGKIVGKVSLGIASFWFPPISIMELLKDGKKYADEVVKARRLLKSIPDRLRKGPWGVLMEVKGQRK